MIRTATPDDAARIAAIYNHYVHNTIITFEEAAVSESEMRTRIRNGLAFCPWFAAEIDGALVGYAYASSWNPRTGYRKSVETTVYVAHQHQRQGLGMKLYSRLIDHLNDRGVHSLVGIIALPNPASVALHERLGFRKIGELREVGWKFGRWVHVGYWQLLQ